MRIPELPPAASSDAMTVPAVRDARLLPVHDDLPEFLVEADAKSGRIALFGELDIGTIGRLDGALSAILAAGAAQIVLDLRGLRFADSSLVHLIQAWQSILISRDIEFTITPGPPAVQCVLRFVAAVAPPSGSSPRS